MRFSDWKSREIKKLQKQTDKRMSHTNVKVAVLSMFTFNTKDLELQLQTENYLVEIKFSVK